MTDLIAHFTALFAALPRCFPIALLVFSIVVAGMLLWMCRARRKQQRTNLLLQAHQERITRQKQRLSEVNRRLNVLAVAIEQSPASIIITDEQGLIQHANKKFTEISGYELEELQGKTPRILKSGHTSDREYAELWRKVKSGQTWRGEFYNRKKNGEYFWERAAISPVLDKQGNIQHFIAIKEDVNALKEYEKNLVEKTYYDNLTGLPNHALFDEKVRFYLQQGISFTVAVINLDGFQKINISHNHAGGDEIIIAMSKRILGVIRQDDVLARLNADEFALLLPTDDVLVAHTVLQSIMEAIRKPFYLANEKVFITARIGVAQGPQHGEHLEVLQRHVFSTLHSAKLDGGNKIAFFRQELDDELLDIITRESELRQALQRNEFELYYQPQIYQQKVCGAEALLRWNSGRYGMVAPDDFIPLAEESGLIVEIGGWVLEAACRQAVNWPEQIAVSVNISPKQFADEGLVDLVKQVLASTGLPAHRLELEITETMMQQDIESTVRILEQLYEIGVRIALDDFGTGYSSLGILGQLPLSVLKLDRIFVSKIVASERHRNLSHAIVKMADILGLRVVAEGVEEKAQLDYLTAWGVEWFQGYYFSRPIPLQQFETMILT